MSTTSHPRAQLSAYLDDALEAGERSSIDAHLAACGDCRERLAELRATASLINALPELRPSRRLAPRLATVPAWLAPLRTLSTLASGLSVFLFLATAVLSQGQFRSAAAPAAAPVGGAATLASNAPFGAAGPAADQATRNASGGAPAPSVPPQAAFATTSTVAPSAVKQAGPTASAAAESQLGGGSSGSPLAFGPVTAADHALADRAAAPSTSVFAMPWFWLVLAVVTGALAFALQRRLRSA